MKLDHPFISKSRNWATNILFMIFNEIPQFNTQYTHTDSYISIPFEFRITKWISAGNLCHQTSNKFTETSLKWIGRQTLSCENGVFKIRSFHLNKIQLKRYMAHCTIIYGRKRGRETGRKKNTIADGHYIQKPQCWTN